MRRIIISLSIIAAAAAVAIGATTSFFSDTETSTGNTFTAGSLDLKVDNVCHYNGLSCATPSSNPNDIVLSWHQNDLGQINKFFYFNDVKPGDEGEDTVSLHVIDNDAWGKLIINHLTDSDNTCTEPEMSPVDQDCTPNQPNGADGELRENLKFWVWLDQGLKPGFQCAANNPGCNDDPQEGDNIDQDAQNGQLVDPEPMLISPGPIDSNDETWNLYEGLMAIYGQYPADSPGLNSDGHLTGSITYYFGIGWELPSSVGNIVQSDIFSGDMTFEVVQYRNNSASPSPGPASWQ